MIFIDPFSAKLCNQFLMQSYMLEGNYMASNDTHPMCNSIKSNCCTTSDMLKIFNDASTKLEPTIQSFGKKIRDATVNLRRMNEKVSKIIFPAISVNDKKAKCSAAQASFQTFDFELFIRNLILGAEKAVLTFRDMHYSFYCMICDQISHKFLNVRDNKISIDANVCINQITRNKDFLKVMNVDLTNYLKNIQVYLDCVLYDKFINFPFLWEDKDKLAISTTACLPVISDSTTEVPSECAEVCNGLKVGAISPTFQGDFIFINKAAGYFSSVVDGINEQFNSSSAFNPLKDLQLLQDPQNALEIQATQAGSSGNSTTKAPAASNTTTTAQPARNLHKSKHNRVQKKKKHIKWRFLSEAPIPSDNQFNANKIVIDQDQLNSLFEDDLRVVMNTPAPSTHQNNHYRQRLLQQVNIIVPKADPAKMALTKKRYEDIQFYTNPLSDEVYKHIIDPSNVSLFSKSFLYQQGINLFTYIENQNFEVSKNEVLKTLGQLQSSPDTQLFMVALIAAFTPSFSTEMSADMDGVYTLTIPPSMQSQLEKTKFKVTPDSSFDPDELMSEELRKQAMMSLSNSTSASNSTSSGTGAKPASPATPPAAVKPRKLKKQPKRKNHRRNRRKVEDLVDSDLNI